MSAQQMPVALAEPSPGRFVSLSLPTDGGGGGGGDGGEALGAARREVVLARLGDELRPDLVVLARGDGAELEVRRVGRVDADRVELLPVDAASPPRTVPRAGDGVVDVVGTVVLRWREG